MPASVDASTPSGPSGAPVPRVVSHRRLDGVDGLRAFAALWVVLFHIRAFSGAHLGPVDVVVRSGSTGVSLFLVLSGFCLYLPVVRGRARRFETWRFLKRRAQRLLPAYYASLVVVLIVTVVAAGRLGFQSLQPLDVLGQAAAHLSMAHAFFPSTFYALNGAYWSLALEWQLYIGLPLLVVCAHRFGLARTVYGVVLVDIVYRIGVEVAIALHVVAGDSLAATAVLPNLLPGRWAEFAFGMVAAELYVSGRLAQWASLLRLAVVPALLLSLVAVGDPLSHLFFGAAFFSLLCVVLAGDNIISRVFSWRPLAALGVMSYSIYLVHQPIVQALAVYLGGRGGSPSRVFVEVLVLTPFVLAVAWLLFVTVERRTIHPGGETEADSPEALLMAPLRLVRQALGWRPQRRAGEDALPPSVVFEGQEP